MLPVASGAAEDPIPRLETAPFVRVEVPAGAERPVTLTITAATAATLLAAEIDCRCISLVESVPRTLPAGVSTLTLRVAGLLPGIKRLTLRSTAGSVLVTLQVAVPGADSALAVLRGLVAAAGRDQARLVLIVHDLGGRLRNCGCSSGSLGGIDHLAALPATLVGLGAADARCVLTGDSDGSLPGVGRALAERGWEVAPGDLLVTADPVAGLARSGMLAVIAAGSGMPPANQRIVRPLLDGGATATVLVVDAGGRIREQQVLPIDASLPAETAILAGFPETRTLAVHAADQVTACAACHPAAAAAWHASAHARAWASLVPERRVDACVTCHTSPMTGAGPQAGSGVDRAQHVSCVACHVGSAAHAAAPGRVRTGGLTDCRSCHDAIHHPAFDPLAAWLRIRH